MTSKNLNKTFYYYKYSLIICLRMLNNIFIYYFKRSFNDIKYSLKDKFVFVINYDLNTLVQGNNFGRLLKKFNFKFLEISSMVPAYYLSNPSVFESEKFKEFLLGVEQYVKFINNTNSYISNAKNYSNTKFLKDLEHFEENSEQYYQWYKYQHFFSISTNKPELIFFINLSYFKEKTIIDKLIQYKLPIFFFDNSPVQNKNFLLSELKNKFYFFYYCNLEYLGLFYGYNVIYNLLSKFFKDYFFYTFRNLLIYDYIKK